VRGKESGPNRGSYRYRADASKGMDEYPDPISRTGGDAMKLIIEVRVECTDSDLRREPTRLAVLDRWFGTARVVKRSRE
jgi:hypothetical protein